MADLIDRQTAIDAIVGLTNCESLRELYEYVVEHDLNDRWSGGLVDATDAVVGLPSADAVEVVLCKDCKHNPKDAWFGCPMSHLSETQKPDTAWCWKGEREDPLHGAMNPPEDDITDDKGETI